MNKPLQNQLWEKIQSFVFDDPTSTFPFSKKLQAEHNWSSPFTNAAIEEYRKFIFLCCILPGGASPSDTVDKVWHLHLTYTTNYWVDFCRNTLQKDIHHHPSKGGNQEQAKHTNWYQQTLQQYQRVFGTQPPGDIWPLSTTVPNEPAIDIYDKQFFQKVVTGFVSLVLIFILATNLFRTSGKDFLVYYPVIIIAGLLVSFMLQENKLKRLNAFIADTFPSNANTFQVSMFLYGAHRTYQTALIDLLKRDIIDTSGDGYTRTDSIPDGTLNDINPLIHAVKNTMAVGEKFSYLAGLKLMESEKLHHPVLKKLTTLANLVDYQKFVIPGIVLMIGFARMVQGMTNGQPVNYLVVEIGIFTIVTLMIASYYSYTSLVYNGSAAIWKTQNKNGYGNDVLNNFTILGVIAIGGFAEYSILSKIFEMYLPARNYASADGGSSYSSGGCSSSDGGSSCSSCGGGCGGCGGGD